MYILNNVMAEKEMSVYAWKRKIGFISKTVVSDSTIEIINDVAEYVCQQLEIGYNYNIVLGYDSSNDRKDVYGVYYNNTRTVWLNMYYLIDDTDEIIDTLAHELLHAEQNKYAPELLKNYVSLEDDPDAYRAQEAEVEANEYGAYIAELFKRNNYKKPMMMAI